MKPEGSSSGFRGKPSIFLLFAPPAMALLVLLAGSLSPVRLDCRTLQHLTRYEGLDERLAGARHLVYLSRDNGVSAGQTATFTLRHLAFPDATRTWLILAENIGNDWWGEWSAVDEQGAFFLPGRPPPTLVPTQMPDTPAIAGSRIICDSREVFLKFQARIPSFAGAADVVFLDDLHNRGGFVFSPPRSEFSPIRFLRLSLLIGAVFTWALLMAGGSCCLPVVGGNRMGRMPMPHAHHDPRSGSGAEPEGRFWLGALAGFVAGVAAQIWLASFSWQAWPVFLAVQWGAGFFLLRGVLLPPAPRVTAPLAAVSAALVISLAVFLARLDFDGDVMTHWLPMARSFYHFGLHDPAALLAQGSMHAATYPPGYGIFLSMAMWAAGMETGRPFLPGPETSLAILLYRLAIWLLNMAFLGILAACLLRRTPRGSWLWLSGVALVTTLFPTIRGTHTGAETLLFPILGSALVLLVMGTGRLPLVGCAIAGVATMIKWEAALLVAAVFAPWFVVQMTRRPDMCSPALLVRTAVVSAAALVPTLIWKAGLHVDNGFFTAASLGGVWAGRAEWVSLLTASLIFLSKSPLWIPLFLLLPVGWIIGNARGFRWSALIVPASTALLFLSFVSMYLFSTWTTKTLHIEQSLDRLLYIPSLSCILYFMESVTNPDPSTSETLPAA